MSVDLNKERELNISFWNSFSAWEWKNNFLDLTDEELDELDFLILTKFDPDLHINKLYRYIKGDKQLKIVTTDSEKKEISNSILNYFDSVKNSKNRLDKFIKEFWVFLSSKTTKDSANIFSYQEKDFLKMNFWFSAELKKIIRTQKKNKDNDSFIIKSSEQSVKNALIIFWNKKQSELLKWYKKLDLIINLDEELVCDFIYNLKSLFYSDKSTFESFLDLFLSDKWTEIEKKETKDFFISKFDSFNKSIEKNLLVNTKYPLESLEKESDISVVLRDINESYYSLLKKYYWDYNLFFEDILNKKIERNSINNFLSNIEWIELWDNWKSSLYWLAIDDINISDISDDELDKSKLEEMSWFIEFFRKKRNLYWNIFDKDKDLLSKSDNAEILNKKLLENKSKLESLKYVLISWKKYETKSILDFHSQVWETSVEQYEAYNQTLDQSWIRKISDIRKIKVWSKQNFDKLKRKIDFTDNRTWEFHLDKQGKELTNHFISEFLFRLNNWEKNLFLHPSYIDKFILFIDKELNFSSKLKFVKDLLENIEIDNLENLKSSLKKKLNWIKVTNKGELLDQKSIIEFLNKLKNDDLNIFLYEWYLDTIKIYLKKKWDLYEQKIRSESRRELLKAKIKENKLIISTLEKKLDWKLNERLSSDLLSIEDILIFYDDKKLLEEYKRLENDWVIISRNYSKSSIEEVFLEITDIPKEKDKLEKEYIYIENINDKNIENIISLYDSWIKIYIKSWIKRNVKSKLLEKTTRVDNNYSEKKYFSHSDIDNILSKITDLDKTNISCSWDYIYIKEIKDINEYIDSILELYNKWETIFIADSLKKVVENKLKEKSTEIKKENIQIQEKIKWVFEVEKDIIKYFERIDKELNSYWFDFIWNLKLLENKKLKDVYLKFFKIYYTNIFEYNELIKVKLNKIKIPKVSSNIKKLFEQFWIKELNLKLSKVNLVKSWFSLEKNYSFINTVYDFEPEKLFENNYHFTINANLRKKVYLKLNEYITKNNLKIEEKRNTKNTLEKIFNSFQIMKKNESLIWIPKENAEENIVKSKKIIKENELIQKKLDVIEYMKLEEEYNSVIKKLLDLWINDIDNLDKNIWKILSTKTKTIINKKVLKTLMFMKMIWSGSILHSIKDVEWKVDKIISK